ncbi:hypothetical protein NJLHNGOC_06580 [Novacetimonas cocois]|uniref:Uncharacterized protein n=1 Tax=Novacetimonas cocois TaxID=1747507 RepID=A0A365YWY6_9PROT|nr:hypothetical protein NJLHNGOC_06580 [Novacetimonas cocois]
MPAGLMEAGIKEVFGEAFCKSFERRRLFKKRRHPKTFVILSWPVGNYSSQGRHVSKRSRR